MRPVQPFSEMSISFLNGLSVLLKNDPDSAKYPEIFTLAFFLRKSNLEQLKKTYYPQNNSRIGTGIVFHITPSNMPLNFAYSLASGILAGNLNVVRMTSRKFRQADIVCNALRRLSEKPEFSEFAQRILVVRYDRSSSATSYLSSICNARLIWGSDQTIKEIQKNTLPWNAADLAFGDKYSIGVINADRYIDERLPEKIANSFYTDTFLFDQNACTSPHLIIWLGNSDNVSDSRKKFWGHLHEIVKKKYELQAHNALSKLTTFCDQAIHMTGIKKANSSDNLIWRVELDTLENNVEKYRSNCGYFAEYTADSLLELSDIISKKYQTIAYYGIEKNEWNILSSAATNIHERLRPFGSTSDFSLTWDGCNLIETLSVQTHLDPMKVVRSHIHKT